MGESIKGIMFDRVVVTRRRGLGSVIRRLLRFIDGWPTVPEERLRRVANNDELVDRILAEVRRANRQAVGLGTLMVLLVVPVPALLAGLHVMYLGGVSVAAAYLVWLKWFTDSESQSVWIFYRVLEYVHMLERVAANPTSTMRRRQGAHYVQAAARGVAKANRVGFPHTWPLNRPPRAFRRRARADVRGMRQAIASRAPELARATPEIVGCLQDDLCRAALRIRAGHPWEYGDLAAPMTDGPHFKGQRQLRAVKAYLADVFQASKATFFVLAGGALAYIIGAVKSYMG